MIAYLILIALAAASTQARPNSVPIGSVNHPVMSLECPPTGHYVLPHEYDCTKFYYCEYGLRWETPHQCAPGTEFSFQLQVCVHPEQANCKLPGVPDLTTTAAPETKEPETDATTSAPSSTESSIVSTTTTTTAAPETEEPETDATTSAPSSTESSIVSTTTTTTAAPETKEPETDATTSAPSSTESSIVSTTTTTTAAPETEEPETDATTSAPSSTESSIVSTTTTTTAAPETEEPETDATTSAPSSTESSIVSTTESQIELLPNGCPADFDIHKLLPHKKDCALFYYCVHGEMVLRECAPGTHFNPTIQVCDWPENAGCASSGSGEDTETDATSSAPSTTEASIVSTTESHTGLLPNGCPADFDIHQLLPHKKDCALFYYCVHGEKVLRECAPGTHFNPTMQVCDWPENAGCASSGSGEDTETDATSSAPSTTEASVVSTTESQTGLLPNGCPADFDIHHLLPHETNCNQFYYCNFGEKVVRDCAPGTYFNSAIQVCDWPENVDCANSGNSGEETETTSSAPSTTEASIVSTTTTTTAAPETKEPETDATTSAPSSTESSIVSTTTTTTAAPETKEPETDATTSAPSSTESSIVSTTTTTTAAPETEEPETDATTSAPSSTESSIVSTTTTTTAAPETEEPETDATTSAPSSTESSIVSTTTTTTAAPETKEPETDATTSAPTSTESSIVSTTESQIELLPNGCPADFDIHKLLPHKKDCALFYYCVHGEMVLRECAPGTHFNPTIQVCDWPENAGCASSGSGEDTETDATSSAPSTTEASVVSTTESETSLLPNGCPADFDIHKLLPHKKDCALFYYCVHGEMVLRECAPGTHFNPTIQVCDWPENAGCANSDSGEDNGNTDTDSGEDNGHTDTDSGEDNGNTDTDSGEDNGNTDTDSGEDNGHTDTDSSEENGNTDTDSGEGEWLTNGCPADFDIHHLLPHETHCNQFYYCNFGEKIVRDCAPGTYFNAAIQVCDWPENVDCANSGNSDEETEATSSAPSSTETTIVSTTTTTTTAAPETEATTSGPSSTDAPIVSTTTTTTTAAPETEATTSVPSTTDAPIVSTTTTTTTAAPESEATTSAPSSTDASSVSTTTTSAPSSTDAPIVSTTESQTELLPNGCPADFDVHHLLPHETNCNQFYYCNFGDLILTDCAPGTYFNPLIQVCDWPENVECPNSGNGSESVEDNGTGDSGEDNGTTDSGEDNSASDSDEDNGTADSDENNGTTDSGEDNGDGWLDNGCPADFNIHYMLPHKSECGKFYQCVHGNVVERDCAAGLHFNPTKQVCDWPASAGCTAGGDSDETGDADVDTEGGSGDGEDIDSGLGAGGDSEEDNTHDDKCAEGCNVAPWAHENDCDKFWHCDGKTAALTVCAEGLHFNQATKTCDFICNAGCIRVNAQATLSRDGVRVFLPWDKMEPELLEKYAVGENRDSA